MRRGPKRQMSAQVSKRGLWIVNWMAMAGRKQLGNNDNCVQRGERERAAKERRGKSHDEGIANCFAVFVGKTEKGRLVGLESASRAQAAAPLPWRKRVVFIRSVQRHVERVALTIKICQALSNISALRADS